MLLLNFLLQTQITIVEIAKDQQQFLFAMNDELTIDNKEFYEKKKVKALI